MTIWETYESPSGRFSMAWRLGFILTRMDGRLRHLSFMGWCIWTDLPRDDA